MGTRKGIGLYISPAILAKAGMTCAEKMVLAEISQLSERHESGCFATKHFIAKRLKLSERTVYYALQNLQKNGLVKTTLKSGKITAEFEAISSAILADPKTRKVLQKLQSNLQKLQSTTAKFADALHIEELPIKIQLSNRAAEASQPPETNLFGVAEKPEAKTRKQDLLFNAVSHVTGLTPSLDAAKIQKLCVKLKSAKPPFTVSEVLALGEYKATNPYEKTVKWTKLIEEIGIVRRPDFEKLKQRGFQLPPKTGAAAKLCDSKDESDWTRTD